ncbi:DNA (cytosine-5-)-methyltransferase [Aquihabitans sp. G128]|uniref:DNA cytosine methyltransferase n=1 Tax=Aquihabitans sp. G128 TaxID=2849779 RepID=UPI001C233963|nr:DNA (cytosine-5-)-methyltransferase [Aquihabitans sp. G128]QXC61725.1 DNA (cytosine-5-)-methyltransferase [Aquihabitans sp. G128]
MPDAFSVAGLFAGIGGIESGLARHGGRSELLCEYWQPAHHVLATQFPDVHLVEDVRDLRSLPKVDLVSAGFPCTDLSQAGRMNGIKGEASGLVGEVFRLLKRPRAPMLMLENVRNMLVLDGGTAMRYLTDELEGLGYKWAYRLVDSRFAGVPQRRQRVIFLASRKIDPRAVLFADDAGEPADDRYADQCHGFYWTEGLRGVGWARDAVPTLKGGSTIGIPSQPGIWNPQAPLGLRIVLPSVEEAEQMQGFPRGWTAPADDLEKSRGTRWKLTGNAVTVGVSSWVGSRLRNPGDPILDGRMVSAGDRWPTAAYGSGGKVWAVDVTMWPTHEPYQHLHDVVDLEAAQPLSLRAASGFLSRANRGNLRFADGFLDDMSEHIGYMSSELSVA